MALPQNPVTIIPARLNSTRLKRKVLADLGGEAMIVHVWRRAMEAELGPVYVACDDNEIADVVTAAGGEAIMTRSDHASGSDRIFEALGIIEGGVIEGGAEFDAVVNIQGDLPTLDPALPKAAFALLDMAEVDIATLATEITNPSERHDANVVKVVAAREAGAGRGTALYFSRATVPAGDGPLYHHIGLYAYRRQALETFIGLPPSGLETRERLEQLRALEAGMRIEVAFVDTEPLGVDTPDDLAAARQILGRLRGA